MYMQCIYVGWMGGGVGEQLHTHIVLLPSSPTALVFASMDFTGLAIVRL